MQRGADEPRITGVQELVELSGEHLVAVPQAFIRPLHDRPHLSFDQQAPHQQLPIVDISGLHSPHTRPQTLLQISQACTDWGFFQAVHHGVRDKVVEEMKAACLRFFNQPASERNKFWSEKYDTPVAYTTSFNPSKEVVRDWKDMLSVRHLRRGVGCNGFDIAPEICREAFQEYRRGVDKLANVLYDAIFESLGLNLAFVKEVVPPLARLVMAVNYYPPCPNPGLTYGVCGHSDPGSVTILLQDEILSNGKYKSIEHRAITNAEKPRVSVASFYGPDENENIAPLPDFVTECEPALYKDVKYREYLRSFFSKELLPNKGNLNLAK